MRKEKDFDERLNKDMDKFLDLISFDEITEMIADFHPLCEIGDMVSEMDNLETEEEKDDLSAKLFSRAIYLISRFSYRWGGRLTTINMGFKDLHFRMERIMKDGM